MLACGVRMLGSTPPLMGGDHLDQAQALQRADVVGHGAERGVDVLGQLHGTRVALAEQRQQPDPQRGPGDPGPFTIELVAG